MDVIDFGFIFFIIISLVILQIVHVRLSICEQELHIEYLNSFFLSQKNVAIKKLMFFLLLQKSDECKTQSYSNYDDSTIRVLAINLSEKLYA